MRAFVSDGPFTGWRSLGNSATERNFFLRGFTVGCFVEGEGVGAGEGLRGRDTEFTL